MTSFFKYRKKIIIFSGSFIYQISVQAVCNIETFSDLFHLPISQVARTEMQAFEVDLAQVTLSTERDKWYYTGNFNSNSFSSSRIYKRLMEHPVVHPVFKWIWSNPCQPKHKVFFFSLLLNDRLSTRNIVRRKHMVIDSYNCVLYSHSIEEVSEHLFLNCRFVQQCWSILGINIAMNNSFPKIASGFRDKLQSRSFMVIWSTKNDLIFNRIQPSVQNCRRKFFSELRLVQHRVKQSLQTSFESWILSLNSDV